MLTSTRRHLVRLGGLAAGVLILALLSAAPALAAPITVQLRVEGSAATLYEGTIATQAETLETPSGNGPHPCNYSQNGRAGGFANGGNPSATPTTALHDAAVASGLAFDAEWFGSGTNKNEDPGDFFVSRVGPDANQNVSPFDSWGFAVNDTTSPVGGCQVALAPGNEVLWAYNYFNLSHLLALVGPSTANVGTPITLHVTDAQTGASLSGAAIGEVVAGVTTTLPSDPVTDSSGNASVMLSRTGTVELKAARADSVRSNGLVVCVHSGSDGTCGISVPGATTPNSTSPGAVSNTFGVSVADVAKVAGIQSGHIYSRRRAPRVLRGTVTVPAGGTLHQVRISLLRNSGRRCFRFDGQREAFVGGKCGVASFFSVGGSESFSYLLPAGLPPGRYVYDIEAINSIGQATKLVAGISHVVFRVR